MKKALFLEHRLPAWQRFEELVEAAERARVPRLDGAEVSEFSRLFRAVCYDLSTVRSRDWGDDIERYLNDLVARGHNNFYRSPPRTRRAARRFFGRDFPRLLRRSRSYLVAATALLVVPGVVAALVVGADPALAERVLPHAQLVELETMYSGPRVAGAGSGFEGGMTGFYLYNNVGIAFRCFATGIFWGIGTAVVLVYNSIVLGTVASFLLARGHGERFFTFVVAHGAFELTAIAIAGAAGLIIGDALLRPGPYRRIDALRRRGVDGVKLAVGAGAMLFVAALVEAFWSPIALPAAIKYVAGSLAWACVLVYLAFAGREGTRT